MADRTIGDLSSVTLDGAALIEVQQSGASGRTTAQAIANLAPLKERTTRTENSGAWTFGINDAGTRVRDSNSEVDITVPTNSSVAFPVGTILWLLVASDEPPTLVPAGGVTLTLPTGCTGTLLRRGSTALIVKTATDVWEAYGEFEEAGIVSFRNVSDGSYTFVRSDAGRVVRFTSASSVSATVPQNSSVAYPLGSTLFARQVGAGQVTFGGAGVTINIPSGSTAKLRAQGSSASLHKVGTDTWDLTGDLEESP